MRNLSFHLTTAQMRARTKTVTRRKGTFWMRLKPGELVCAVEKSQGVKKGGLVRIGVIRIVSVRAEKLNEIIATNFETSEQETVREGFPEMSGVDFCHMFMDHMGGDGNQTVTRIEFEHTDLPVPK